MSATMSSLEPTIAVVIPCHNAELYLAQTLGSVLDQTRPPKEVIVVDDGSTDSSLAIARRFQSVCRGQLKVHSEYSGSGSRSRNIGAALSTSEALMFLDADDVLAPDTLAALADRLVQGNDGIAACPWRRLDRQEGRWISQPATCSLRKLNQDPLSAWLSGWYYPPCSVLWSRQAFAGTGGWDEEAMLNQDGDIMMRALADGTPLLETGAGTAYYRRLPEGQVSQSGKRLTYGGLAGRLSVLEKIARRLEEKGTLAPYCQALSQAFAMVARDAGGLYGGLCRRADVLRRYYAPPVHQRLLGRVQTPRQQPDGYRPDPAPPRDQPDVIQFGLTKAKSLMTAAPVAEACAMPPARQARSQRPAVSVVIPVYNRAALLPRTLTSVLKQTFSDFEVLVVDDCSSDDPESVVAAFADARLKYVRQPENRGVAAARNCGLRMARAPLVAFLDDDDEWLPDKLQRQVDVFRRAPGSVGMVYTGVETVSEGGVVTFDQATARGQLYDELLVKKILHGGGSCIMMRRNIITTVGFFDERLPAIEDYDYWLRISRHYQVECVGRPLIRYNDMRSADTKPGSDVRRSLNAQANLAARGQFYRRHGAAMRRLGVAHLFLLDSAARHQASGTGGQNDVRRLVLGAFMLAPLSWGVRHWLRQSLTPRLPASGFGRGKRKCEFDR